jgi:hypothetical protein
MIFLFHGIAVAVGSEVAVIDRRGGGGGDKMVVVVDALVVYGSGATDALDVLAVADDEDEELLLDHRRSYIPFMKSLRRGAATPRRAEFLVADITALGNSDFLGEVYSLMLPSVGLTSIIIKRSALALR